MENHVRQAAAQVLAPLKELLPALESLYTDVHAHPELSMQEQRTAGLAAERLRAAGYEVTTGVGGTGVVGVLRNGPGPTVMLRADMDALPVAEATGLPYASTVTATDREGRTVPVMHACGHDMHVACLAAATVMRLQTIVARELSPNEAAVVTVGSLQAGTKENVIPDEAVIKLNVRSYDPQVRKRVLDAIERIVNAEAAASGAPRPPEFTMLDSYPMGVNDGSASGRVGAVFRDYFPAARVHQTGPTSASEDFGSFGQAWQVPAVFWFVGGTDPDTYARAKAAGEVNKIPSNHSPFFAPVLHPTLETGVETLVTAALAWLAGGEPAGSAKQAGGQAAGH